MARYAVGDIQGCLRPLQCLLEQVCFDPLNDELWSVGDLVNRGPDSLATLRYIKSLGSACKIVLGNHDLHLLAAYHGIKPLSKKDSLEQVLQAPDADQLCHWLQHQPLLRITGTFALVHAGIPAIWSLEQAEFLAQEVEAVLTGDNALTFFQHMYGNSPACWSDDLQGPDRWRVITNYFTRMRFCTKNGTLDFVGNGPPESAPDGFSPWFQFAQNKFPKKIVFGHWASMEGSLLNEQFAALDTGCVWGGKLRLLDLDTGELHHCDC